MAILFPNSQAVSAAVATNATMDTDGDYSFWFWVKANSTQNWANVFRKGGNTTLRGFVLYYSTNNIWFDLYDTGGTARTTQPSTTLTLANWNFVAGTTGSSPGSRLYYGQIGTAPTEVSYSVRWTGGTTPDMGSSNFTFDRYSGQGSDHILSSIAFYSGKILTLSQIQALWQATKPHIDADLHLQFGLAGKTIQNWGIQQTTITQPGTNESVVGHAPIRLFPVRGVALAPAAAAQNITAAGAIASAEAFGTAVVTPGATTVSPGSIATGEALGTAVLTPGAVTITLTGMGSAEVFGTATVAILSALDILGNEGRLTVANHADAYAKVIANSVPKTDQEYYSTFHFLDNGAGAELRISLRTSGDWLDWRTPTQAYELVIPNNGTTVILNRIKTGSRVQIGSFSFTPDTRTYGVRFQADGDLIQARIWDNGIGEPGTWDVSYTDTIDPITGDGGVQLGLFYVSGSHVAFIDSVNIDDPPVTGAQTLYPSAIVSVESHGSHTITPGATTVSPSGIAGAETFGTTAVIVDSRLFILTNEGVMGLGTGAGAYARAIAKMLPASNEELLVKFRFSDVTNAGTLRFFLRSTGEWDTADKPTQAYEVAITNTGDWVVNRIVSGIRTQIGSQTQAFLVDTDYWIRFQTVELYVRARIWQDGAGEPGSWQEDIAEFVGDSILGFTTPGVFQTGYFSDDDYHRTTLDTLSVNLGTSPSQTVTCTGISSAEAFGNATITTGAVTITCSGIGSAEAFGTATITLTGSTQNIVCTSIVSGEAIGTPYVQPYFWPFTDDLTGTDDAPWNSVKWGTGAG